MGIRRAGCPHPAERGGRFVNRPYGCKAFKDLALFPVGVGHLTDPQDRAGDF